MTTPERTEKFKGTRGCTVKHFAFYYDNSCQVHKEAKYGTSYWPQKPSPDGFRDMKKEEDVEDRIWYGKNVHRNDQPENQKNPYLNTDYNSLYNFNPEKEIFSDIENTRIRSYAV